MTQRLIEKNGIATPQVHNTTTIPAIEVRSVWKIFGDERLSATLKQQILDGEVSAAQARRDHGCTVSVQDVSFSVFPGEIFCVMGLSGSGKSTLIRHINRLIEPTAGDILLNNESVCSANERELRALRANRVGMVFQNMALLPHRSVESNVGLSLELRSVGAEERASTVARVLDTVGLTGWGGCQISELSGGMQQRVGLARALAADPDILLMDEPFSALDPLIRRQLQDEFKSLSRNMGKTTVFITHDLDEAIRIGDRIAIMKDGRFVQVGTPAEIIMRPADDFVSEFVSGISRLTILTARHVMLSKADFQIRHTLTDGDLLLLQVARLDSSLCDLVSMAAKDQRPIAIKHEHEIVGIVTLQALFQSVLEGHAA